MRSTTKLRAIGRVLSNSASVANWGTGEWAENVWRPIVITEHRWRSVQETHCRLLEDWICLSHLFHCLLSRDCCWRSIVRGLCKDIRWLRLGDGSAGQRKKCLSEKSVRCRLEEQSGRSCHTRAHHSPVCKPIGAKSEPQGLLMRPFWIAALWECLVKNLCFPDLREIQRCWVVNSRGEN